MSCFSRCISFDFTCYLEPKVFRELTRKPTGSFSFLACTLCSLILIVHCKHIYQIVISTMYIDKSIIKIILLYSILLSERTVALAFFYMYPLEGLYERKYVNSDCPNIPVFLENPESRPICDWDRIVLIFSNEFL